MRFYPDMKFFRQCLTGLMVGTALCGLWMLWRHHAWMGAVYVFLGGMQTNSLWTRYWEFHGDGTLESRGYGTRLRYLLADLRYAGPVRGEVSFPTSAKKDLEVEFDGSVRYARVSDKASFLEMLHQTAPHAKVVPLWLIGNEEPSNRISNRPRRT